MKKKYFLRRAGQYFLIMLIPTMLLFLALVIITQNSIKDGLKENGARTVLLAQNNLETEINGIIMPVEYLVSGGRVFTAVRHVLNRDNLSYGDAIFLRGVQVTLGSIAESHAIVDSIYLYLDGCTRVVASAGGIVDLGEDTEPWMQVYRDMPDGANYHVARCELRRKGEGAIDVLTICHRLLRRDGGVIVNLAPAALSGALDKVGSNDFETVYLLDETGKLLLSTTGEEEDSGTACLQSTLEGRGTSAAGEYLQSLNGQWVGERGQGYLLTSGVANASGITVVSMISRKAQAAALYGQALSLVLLLTVSLFVVVVLAYLTTRRSFRQIHTVMQMFDDAENGEKITRPKAEKDEYDVIMNNIVYMFLNTSYLNVQLKEEAYRKENAELMALQMQINPHFLFNTLQTLDMEARRKRGCEKISEIVGYVSDILKYALGDPQKVVAIEEEILYLKKYAEVQKYRFGDKFIIYYEIAPEALNKKAFRLMLQPVLENSLLHGLRALPRVGYVKVKIRCKAGFLEVRIIDSGVGMDRQELAALRERSISDEGGRIGLTNLNRRLQLRYGEQSMLHIHSQKGVGTSVSFTIPAEEMPSQ